MTELQRLIERAREIAVGDGDKVLVTDASVAACSKQLRAECLLLGVTLLIESPWVSRGRGVAP